MSSDGAVRVEKTLNTVAYWGKYQTPLALAAGIYIARKLYAARPESYERVFASPKQFEIEHFIVDDGCNGGDCIVTIDLDKETVFFDWWTFIAAIEMDGGIEGIRTWYNKLKPFCQKVPKKFDKKLQELSGDDYLSELIEECGLEDKGFLVPFVNLESVKDLGYPDEW